MNKHMNGVGDARSGLEVPEQDVLAGMEPKTQHPWIRREY
jgi:hypothetical protein